MPHLFTKIEIAAPPSIVREKFLQFEQIPTYSPNGFFKWLGPTEKNAPLEPGTRMHNVLEGMVIDPIILVSPFYSHLLIDSIENRCADNLKGEFGKVLSLERHLARDLHWRTWVSI